VRRGTGEDKDGAAFEQVAYEGFAPHGVALIVEVVTDNRNRTVADVRHALTRAGGNMAEAGSVTWQFKRQAYFAIPSKDVDADRIFELAVEAGADDVVTGEDDIEIFAPVEAFKQISDRLREAGVRVAEASLRMVPTVLSELPPEHTLQVMRLIESLEELDDVQQVYSTLKITEAAVAMLEAA
jgi:YebC/PmpR family DNA-binding regulatory protein